MSLVLTVEKAGALKPCSQSQVECCGKVSYTKRNELEVRGVQSVSQNAGSILKKKLFSHSAVVLLRLSDPV